ncbi:(2Fe-2S)-binding protein [Candidatus Uabimicrobium sp. HlEnr_7]|uniref:(2Fe-2S)-binding protein n=1 Tax=Candidatus Uabimicrobium helgolandensis TaxID=3095367 RepID=UPI00355698B2
MKIAFTLNGQETKAEFTPGETLFHYLRSDEIYSVKNGCELGECGACTVLVDNKAQNSCLILMHTLEGTVVETIENLGSKSNLHHLQQKFIDEGAVQCGYCTPGMILASEALLRESEQPTSEQVKDALAGNLCRCTGYVKPIKAVCNE